MNMALSVLGVSFLIDAASTRVIIQDIDSFVQNNFPNFRYVYLYLCRALNFKI